MGPGEAIYAFDSMTLLGRRYFFRIVDAGNHEVLAASQTYKTEHQRDKTARRFSELLAVPVLKGKPR